MAWHFRIPTLIPILFAMACAAADPPQVSGPPAPADAFMARLQALCGKAYEGRVVTNDPADTAFAGKRLVMHVRECAADEVRIPFHVGDDRSRTWIVTRTATGLRLKHDHRHADGQPDELTMYGGDTIGRRNRAPAGISGRRRIHRLVHAHQSHRLQQQRLGDWRPDRRFSPMSCGGRPFPAGAIFASNST